MATAKPCSEKVTKRAAQAMCDQVEKHGLCHICGMAALESAMLTALCEIAELDLPRAQELAKSLANRLVLAESAESAEAFAARLFRDEHAPGVH